MAGAKPGLWSQGRGGLLLHHLLIPPLPPSLHCRGAFSYLRRVTEKSTRLDFAAKFVPGRTKAKQSARRELHILSQLDHERIVFFHDAFEKKNAVIMVMELYPSGTAPGARGVQDGGRLLGGDRWAEWVWRSWASGERRAWWGMELLCSLTGAQLRRGGAAGQDGEEALGVRVRGG